MRPFDVRFPPRIVGGPGAARNLGRLVRDVGGTNILLIGDEESTAAGCVARVRELLERGGLSTVCDGGVPHDVIVIVGSAPVRKGHVPVVLVPNLIGRIGSLMDDGASRGLATGDCAAVLLDAELSLGTTRAQIASTMIDATTNAIEAWVSTRRTDMSDLYAREAWRQLASSVPRLLNAPDDLEAMSAALFGSFLASAAAEHSTLGAAHACARPVSRRYGVPHGTALALLLPEVVRWNSRVVADRYAELAAIRGEARRPETLVARLEDLISATGFPERLATAGVVESELPALAVEASADRVGAFNPRKFDVAGALEIYAAAY
jgi:alcohol dehydrogenase class IV